MSFLSSWCIGSVASLSAQDLVIAGDAQTIGAGNYYLYDAVDALSLLAAVDDAMNAAGVAGSSVVLLGSGKVRLAGAVIFTVTWTDTTLRDLLGFAGNLAGASSYTATLKSPLFWSPGKPELPQLTPLGVRGAKLYNVVQSVAPYSGLSESASHGFRERASYTWSHVEAARVRTPSELGGEFGTWYERVAVPSARWKLYRLVPESSSSTSAFTHEGALGPYVTTIGGKGGSWVYDRSRGADWTDLVCDLNLSAHVCPEYDS